MKQEEAMELVKFLNLEEAENLDEAKNKFQENWIQQKELNSKIGKITGSISNVTRKAFEPFGVTLNEDDFKEQKIEDVLRSASEKAKIEFEKQKDEWEKRASKDGSSDLIKEWEKKYSNLEKKFNETDSARQDAIVQFDNFKIKVEEEKKELKINSVFEKEFASIKVDPTINQLTIKGFKSDLSEKYIFDLDTDGSVIIKDKKSQERIKSTIKAGTFLGINDVLIKEATDAGIIQKNPHAGKPNLNKSFIVPIENNNNSNKQKGVNPRFFGGV
jgi:hypothetical protein